jgi:hypothetical protein
MVRFQDSILEHLHHHTFSNILFDGIFKSLNAQILSCSGSGVGVWLIIWLISLSFQLTSLVFFTLLWIWLGLPHPSIASIYRCMCTHPIDPMGIHFLCCDHGNECTWTNGVVYDTFVAIMRNVGFHMGWKQHVLPSNTFNSSRWQVDIVFTKDGICTLVHIVIVDPTKADLLPWLS